MQADFSTLQNARERPVFEAVLAGHRRHPRIDADLLPDVACVALNRLPPHYVRHAVDLAFYQTDTERTESDRAVHEAVEYAFGFVQVRDGIRTR